MMRILTPALLALCAYSGVDRNAAERLIVADRYQAHIKLLASGELEGRGTGSQGQKAASIFLSSHFKKCGLEPGGENGSYLQPFSVRIPKPLQMSKESYLEIWAKDQTKKAGSRDFMPFGFSKPGEVEGPLVFVGYSISNSDLHYDDFAGVDVKGKIALCLRYSPGKARPDSAFGPAQNQVGAFVNKAKAAAAAGAKGLILVNDASVTEDNLMSLWAGGESSAIPFIQMKRSLAEELLKTQEMDLNELQKKIDAALKPDSFEIPGVTVRFRADLDNAEKKETPTENVIGILRGSDPELSKECVVIGAHYDHVGFGDYGANPNHRGKIHHGADDNASGTSGLMELVSVFTQLDPRPKRSVVFIAFTGEELGLYGSAHYVEHPVFPLEKTTAMINMDMIGRSKEGHVEVGGVGTAKDFANFVEELNKGIELELKFDPKVSNDSDHYNFSKKKIPILFFFTGFHEDYHQPGDTWDKINVNDAVRVSRLAFRCAYELANRPERLEYKNPKRDS